MFTGLSGLTANSRNLDTIGNNIANVNTTAFKSSRLIFATQFSRNLSLGGGPSAATGGTNPRQVGLGVTIAGTQRDFTTGSLSATGGPSDLSITGDGFFMVNRGGQTLYTRAGSFTRNSNGELVNVSGDRVLGWSSDNTFQVDRTQLTPLTIPLGKLRIAEASTTAIMNGTLNNSYDPDPNIGSFVATTGSAHTLAAMTDTSGPIATTSLVTNLRNGPAPIAAVGDVIALRSVDKGLTGASRKLPDATLTVTASTTLQDVMDFLARGLGIQNTGETPTPGVTLTAGGVVRINGNSGENNNIGLLTSMLRVEPPTGAATNPLAVAPVPNGSGQPTLANGESQYTQFSVFDSLGNRVNLNLTMTMVARGTTAVPGSRWRYDINSPDNAGGTRVSPPARSTLTSTGIFCRARPLRSRSTAAPPARRCR
jgi:flagellar hook protein FlgE